MKVPFSKVVVDHQVEAAPFTRGLLDRLAPEVAVEVRGEGEPKPRGRSVLFVTREPGEFLKACPCTPGVVECGYRVFTLGFQCPYRCSYCFLRFYAPDEPLTLYANLEEGADEFRREASGWSGPVRVGTGEFADSLALDPWTDHARWVADLVKPFPNALMELKTKSDNIDGVMNAPVLDNLITAWSVNPPDVVAGQEAGTATLDERLAAAATVAGSGRRVAFHFDPIIAVEGWREQYARVVEALFEAADPERVAWISLGTLRFPKRFLDAWGARLKANPIFFDEFVLCPDGKLRYFWPLRKDVYRFVSDEIEKRSGGRTPVYLCMESAGMWSGSMDWSPPEGEVERRLCNIRRTGA